MAALLATGSVESAPRLHLAAGRAEPTALRPNRSALLVRGFRTDSLSLAAATADGRRANVEPSVVDPTSAEPKSAESELGGTASSTPQSLEHPLGTEFLGTVEEDPAL